MAELTAVHADIVSCDRCPRLRSYCQRVAREKRRAYLDRHVLGPPRSRLRRSTRSRPDRRAGAGRPWREPHGPRVHGRRRRRLRRLSDGGAPSRRLRQPDDITSAGRWADVARRVYPRGRALCTAGEQADARRNRELPPPLRCGARRARERVGRRGAWEDRVRCLPEPAEVPRVFLQAASRIRSRRRTQIAERPHADRLLSSEPAEYAHRKTHRADDGRGLREGSRASTGSRGSEVPGSGVRQVPANFWNRSPWHLWNLAKRVRCRTLQRRLAMPRRPSVLLLSIVVHAIVLVVLALRQICGGRSRTGRRRATVMAFERRRASCASTTSAADRNRGGPQRRDRPTVRSSPRKPLLSRSRLTSCRKSRRQEPIGTLTRRPGPIGDPLGGPEGNIAPPAPVVSPPPPQPKTPIRPHSGIKPPARVVYVAPVYPLAARAAHKEGVVIIEATIDEQGNVTDTQLLRSIPLLDEAALAAVRQWKFSPTLLNGTPVPIVMTVTVNFTLTQ